jgi:hypothetical protein
MIHENKVLFKKNHTFPDRKGMAEVQIIGNVKISMGKAPCCQGNGGLPASI